MPEIYSAVRERDFFRCRICGDAANLEVHHIIYRSHGGPHEDWNLISLCRKHHHQAHSFPKEYPKWILHTMAIHNVSWAEIVHSYILNAPPLISHPICQCLTCCNRTETNWCELFEQDVSWDYSCDAWSKRSFR